MVSTLASIQYLQEKAPSQLLSAAQGRSLVEHVNHPEVTGPADFTHEIAIEFVAAVMDMKVGEWISAERRSHLPRGAYWAASPS